MQIDHDPNEPKIYRSKGGWLAACLMKSTTVAAICISLIACEKSYKDQSLAIENYFAKGKTGSSPDYFLVKDGFTGPERVAVIYGFMSDQEFCYEIAELYMQKHPQSKYFCVPANQ